MSREHIWPDWAYDLLPKSKGYGRALIQYRQGHDDARVHNHVERQGSITTSRFRVVCVKCNTGWMSRLETAVKPMMTSMIGGHLAFLTPDDTEIVRSWIFLKLAVLDRSDTADSAFRPNMLRAFYEGRTVPPELTIWIARCGQPPWGSCFRAHTATVGDSPTPPASDGMRNVKTFAFGVGDLFVLAVLAINAPIEITPDPRLVKRIHPGAAPPMLWPPPRIGAAGAFRLATALEGLLAGENVTWVDTES